MNITNTQTLFYKIFTFDFSLGKKGSLWTNIERRIEAKIEQYATYQHFNDLENQGYWTTSLDILRSCPEHLKIRHLKQIVSHKGSFMPQDNDDVQFSPFWAQTINSFMVNMVAVYLELIQNDKVPACGLYQELTSLRADLLVAIKSLYGKRWRGIRGFDAFEGNDYAFRASLRFRDETTGETWPPTFSEQDQRFWTIDKVKPDIFKV